MTQEFPQPPRSIGYMEPVARPTNVLGLIGFIFVMIGLLGVCITPALLLGVVGAVLCLIGVFREPRGLAVAGLIVGSIELLFGLVIMVFIGLVMGGAAFGLNAAVKAAQTVQIGQQVRTAVKDYADQNGTLPSSLGAVPNMPPFNDAWGRAIHYRPNSPTVGAFELVSDGPDGKPGTFDDLHLNTTSLPTPTTMPLQQP